jgi:FkbM family methyltransferase
MNIIDKVLSRPELEEYPPVLVDVGASSGVNPAWRALAKYSICIAFDADDRGMGQTRRDSNLYKQLHVYNRILTSGEETTSDFYLTHDAPCSSMLLPDTEGLSAWEFADRFVVVEKQTVPTTNLQAVLTQLNLDRVDWFKSDSQGIDLRLFLSLGDALVQRVLMAEFEPGVIDAYQGDDKLWTLMSCMHDRGFWMSDMSVLGSNRIRKDLVKCFTQFERNYMVHLLKTSPGWAEVTYMNSFSGNDLGKREYLLGWVCASIKRQYGFALELAVGAKARFADSLFESLQQHSLAAIRRSYLNLPAYLPLFRRAFRRWKRLGLHWKHPTAGVVASSQGEGVSSKDTFGN